MALHAFFFLGMWRNNYTLWTHKDSYGFKILQNSLKSVFEIGSPRQDVPLQGVKGSIQTYPVYAVTGNAHYKLTTSPSLADKLHSRHQSGVEKGSEAKVGRLCSPESKSTAKEKSEKNNILAAHFFSFQAL